MTELAAHADLCSWTVVSLPGSRGSIACPGFVEMQQVSVDWVLGRCDECGRVYANPLPTTTSRPRVVADVEPLPIPEGVR